MFQYFSVVRLQYTDESETAFNFESKSELNSLKKKRSNPLLIIFQGPFFPQNIFFHQCDCFLSWYGIETGAMLEVT